MGGGEAAADGPAAPQLCLPAPVDQRGNERRVPAEPLVPPGLGVAWAAEGKGGRRAWLGPETAGGEMGDGPGCARGDVATSGDLALADARTP